jgi:hypothetical protein
MLVYYGIAYYKLLSTLDHFMLIINIMLLSDVLIYFTLELGCFILVVTQN